MHRALGLLCGCAVVKKRVGSGGDGRLRDVYAAIFKSHRLLPDAVGRQNPWVLFAMLDELEGGETDHEKSEHLSMLYDV